MPQETHKSKKTPAALRVRFRAATVAEFITQQASNLSSGGIFIKSKTPLPRGTLMVYDFQLQDGSPLIKGVGRVVWARRPEVAGKEPPGMGIKFIRVEPESTANFNQIMAATGGGEGPSDIVVRLGEQPPTPIPVLPSGEAAPAPSVSVEVAEASPAAPPPSVGAAEGRTASFLHELPLVDEAADDPTSRYQRQQLGQLAGQGGAPPAPPPIVPPEAPVAEPMAETLPAIPSSEAPSAMPSSDPFPSEPQLSPSSPVAAELTPSESALTAAPTIPQQPLAERVTEPGTPPASPFAAPPVERFSEAPPPKSSSALIYAIIILAIAVVLGGAYAAYMYVTQSSASLDVTADPGAPSILLPEGQGGAPEQVVPSASADAAVDAVAEATGDGASDAVADGFALSAEADAAVPVEPAAEVAEAPPAHGRVPPALRRLIIRSQPDGVLVSINGMTAGRTPLELTNDRVSMGRTLRIRLSKIGLNIWEESISPRDPRWNSGYEPGVLVLEAAMTERRRRTTTKRPPRPTPAAEGKQGGTAASPAGETKTAPPPEEPAPTKSAPAKSPPAEAAPPPRPADKASAPETPPPPAASTPPEPAGESAE
jgi:uncharacterized protein (TIGR02266 family)